MRESWDAVVIGAGPAGAVTARELARGCRTLLVDRARFPRSKVCGCCLNGNAIAALHRLGLSQVLQDGVPLKTMMLTTPGASAELKLNDGVALGRDRFDQSLVDEARAAGATFLDGTAAKVETHSAEEVTLQLSGGREPPLPAEHGGLTPSSRESRFIQTKIVIQASGLAGSESQVSPGSRIGGGTLIHGVPEFYESGRLYMASGRGGYVGHVRLADGTLDVGAAFDAEFVRTAGGLGEAANAILQATGWPAIPEATWKGTAALTRRRVAIAEHRLFAVGDATGYVEPFTGEGMAWAITSAAALAPIAARAIHTWNDDCIVEWRRAHSRIVGRRQWLCRAAARVLRSPTLTGLAVRALALAPVLARPFVARLDRPTRPIGHRA